MIKKILFGEPLVFESDGKPVGWYNNCFNGTFSNGKPISIMINKGEVIRGNSCHYIWRKPESVLWIKKDGTHGVSRVQTYTQIPGYKDIIKAIGGLGVTDSDPKAEGFCKFTSYNIFLKEYETKNFSDVTRRANHSVFGFKEDVFFSSIIYGNLVEVKAECLKQGFNSVILGDGGSWAACNTDDYDLNINKSQYSMVQMINLVDVELYKEPVKPKSKWNYFDYSEFDNTKDGYANETKDELIDVLDQLRTLIGRSITITSGFRTVKFNKLVGGDPNSEHIYGLAADLRFDFTGYTKESLARICKYLGVKNLGVYWNTDGSINRLHIGVRDDNNGKLKLMDWKASGQFIKKVFI